MAFFQYIVWDIVSFLLIDLLHACDNFVIGLFPVFRPIIGLLLSPLPQAIPVCCTAVWAKVVPNLPCFILKKYPKGLIIY